MDNKATEASHQPTFSDENCARKVAETISIGLCEAGITADELRRRATKVVAAHRQAAVREAVAPLVEARIVVDWIIQLAGLHPETPAGEVLEVLRKPISEGVNRWLIERQTSRALLDKVGG